MNDSKLKMFSSKIESILDFIWRNRVFYIVFCPSLISCLEWLSSICVPILSAHLDWIENVLSFILHQFISSTSLKWEKFRMTQTDVHSNEKFDKYNFELRTKVGDDVSLIQIRMNLYFWKSPFNSNFNGFRELISSSKIGSLRSKFRLKTNTIWTEMNA